jgi:hypothetical protein
LENKYALKILKTDLMLEKNVWVEKKMKPVSHFSKIMLYHFVHCLESFESYFWSPKIWN